MTFQLLEKYISQIDFPKFALHVFVCDLGNYIENGLGFSWNRSRKNYQYSAEGQKLHEKFAPVLVIISGKSLVFSRKIILPVLVFAGTAPPTRQHQ